MVEADGELETEEERVLADLLREIDRETEAVAALADRSRVLEVETASWRSPVASGLDWSWVKLFLWGVLFGFLESAPVTCLLPLLLWGSNE